MYLFFLEQTECYKAIFSKQHFKLQRIFTSLQIRYLLRSTDLHFCVTIDLPQGVFDGGKTPWSADVLGDATVTKIDTVTH